MIAIIKLLVIQLRDSTIDMMTFLFELLSAGLDYIFDIAIDFITA